MKREEWEIAERTYVVHEGSNKRTARCCCRDGDCGEELLCDVLEFKEI
jgi:hypothetical protein